MSDSQKYIPAIGTAGYFDLLTPFNTQVATNERFTLKSVRTISDYLAGNEDVKNNVYVKNAIDADYENDLKNDTEILGIQSDRGAWVYVPITYVKCYPVVNGIPYRKISIVLPIQAIPVNTELSTVLSELSNTIASSLGFPATGIVIETSKVILVSSDAHANLQLDRAINKAILTPAAQINKLNNDLTVALAKITALEDYIVANP